MSTIKVTSTAHAGYRRGGVSLSPGVNTFTTDQFTKLQLLQIQNDPRLLLNCDEQSDDSSQASENKSASGNVDAHSVSDLVELIKSLDPEDTTLWKKDNSPKADAFPKGVTAEQREAAWAEVQAEQEA